MERRIFIRAALVGAVAAATSASAKDEMDPEDAGKEAGDVKLAAPCGLYCGVCQERRKDRCHGCGCDCGRCAGKPHADYCGIAKCVRERGLKSCCECGEMPCTKLIQFTNDPVWQTHSACIENLRRQAKIGRAAWVEEQQEYWKDEKALHAWDAFGKECSDRAAARRKAMESRR